MHVRRLATAVATLLASLVTAGLVPAAAEGHVAGWTNGCFGTGCVPSTSSSLQVIPHLGMLYVNGTFAVSTADDVLTLGGSPSIPNVDNLGMLMLGALGTSYEGEVFDLRVRMGGASVAVPAVLHGAVSDAGEGGVVVDFDDTPHPVTLGDGTAVSVVVHDVSLAPGATVALSGTMTTGTGAAPQGAAVAAPVPDAVPLAIAGTAGGAPLTGSTLGGVLPISLGTVTVPTEAAVRDDVMTLSVDLTAPVALHAELTATVRGTVVAAATGAYVVDFADAPVSVALPDGGAIAVSANDLAVAPGHTATLTGQIVQPPSNRPPVAEPDTYTRRRGNHRPVVTIGVLANDHDPEGAALTADVVAAPTRGTVVFQADGTFTYAPAPNYQSDDRFTYRVSDGLSWSAPATVTITVERSRP
jgi:hypothetical protein